MRKKDIAVVVLLFALLMSWPYLYTYVSVKILHIAPKEQVPVPQNLAAGSTNAAASVDSHGETNRDAFAAAPAEQGKGSELVAPGPGAETPQHSNPLPDQLVLTSRCASVSVSSWGGGISSATLSEFRRELRRDSGPVVFDFSGMPALAYSGIPGLSTNYDFKMASSNGSIRVVRETSEGLRFERTLSFANDYEIAVVDRLVNTGTNPLVLPEQGLAVGPMRNIKGETQTRGVEYLGIDSQSTELRQATRYWGSGSSLHGEPSLSQAFLPREQRGGCSWTKPPLTAWVEPQLDKLWPSNTSWVATKNKFFVQILAPKITDSAKAITMHAKRLVSPATIKCAAGSVKGKVFELNSDAISIGSASNNDIVVDDPAVAASHCRILRTDWKYSIESLSPSNTIRLNGKKVSAGDLSGGDSIEIGASSFVFRDGECPERKETWSRMAMLDEVSARMIFPGATLAPGESFTREVSYYVGPKKYAILKKIGKESVMEFGFWSFMCKILLPILTFLYRIIPSYGIAIILLTVLIRIVFWPLMQKSTDSMRRMQELQPQLAALKIQYKDDQPKMLKKQQELFKENKVSPIGGCLPMLIQIPVMIGLFTVLRSAVELRFEQFLWIRDLSEPEGLLAGYIPFWPYQLNILPIVMTAIQIWQSKLTPAAGDPQQQKMMMIMMPLMFLVLFYNMASALVLYWTVSQVLAVVQLLVQQKQAKGKASKPANQPLQTRPAKAR